MTRRALKAPASLDISGTQKNQDSCLTSEKSKSIGRFQHTPQESSLRSFNDFKIIQTSFPWDAQNLPAFIRNTACGRQSIQPVQHFPASAQRDAIDMSDIFYSTMQSVLRRASSNFINSDFFRLSPQSCSSYYNHDNFSSFSNGMGIQYRHFSTAPKPSEEKEEKGESPTPPSTSKALSAPKTSTSMAHSVSVSDKSQAMVTSAIKSLVSLIAKTPGILWFYMTHPKEFKEKMVELKEAAKKEAHHYYMGSKLLIADVRTAKTIIGQTLQGTPLSRRERKQLLRTVTDVFRLVPMSIFVLIPFMEFALPFALKLFPNMLPSTFQDSLKAEETMKRELKSRITMAEFFQETLHDLAKEQKKKAKKHKERIVNNDGSSSDIESIEDQEETAASFLEFIKKARNGEFLPPEVVVRYAKYFKDELTLDNMPRMQLINMCKYMSIPPYGNDNVLRFQLRHKVRGLIEDDQKILWEGIDSLTKMELREACQERGMRSTGLSKAAYKRALQQWIDLSVNRNVPISLLVMSRTFFLHEEMTGATTPGADESKSVTGLADAISGLDKEVLNEVILEVVRSTEEKDPDLMKLKLEVLEQQNELIEEEKLQRDAEVAKAEAAKAEKEKTEKKQEAEEAIESAEIDDAAVESQPSHTEPSISDTTIKPAELKNFTGKRKAEQLTESSSEEKTEKEEEDASLSSQEIDAISQLVSPDPVSAEREQLESIKAALNKEDDEEVEEEGEEVQQEADTIANDETKADEIGRRHDAETPELITVEAIDENAEAKISALNEEVKAESDASTIISLDGKINEEEEELTAEAEEDYSDKKLDKAIARLKSKVESMVGNLEIQISDVEAKIGDKLHFLDKDMDGILSREEMAICLQSVLKRPLTFDEAMAIAAEMDENEDGLFSVEELSKWLETNKLLKLSEEGRDAEIDKIIETQAAKTRESNEQEKSEDDK